MDSNLEDAKLHDGLTQLVCASLNQQRAPLDVRALAADANIDWAGALHRSLSPTCSWFILSTCNRFEIYIHASDVNAENLAARLAAILTATFTEAGFNAGEVVVCFDMFLGARAAEHLCRVAAGIESKVFGESEILGQVTRAYTGHVAQHRLNLALDAIVRTAMRAGIRIRHETRIGANAGSIGSLALNTVEAGFRRCSEAVVAVVGVGEMGRLVARGALERGARVLLINRTYATAQQLAQEIGAEAVPWEQLPSAVQRADIVFCATAAHRPVITPDLLQEAEDLTGAHLPARENGHTRPTKVLVDLAVPRDIDPAVAQTGCAQVLDLDSLQIDLDQSLAERHTALPQAEAIIQAELTCLRAQLRELVYRPLIVDLRQQAEQIRQQELARTLKYVQDADPDTIKQLEHLTHALVNKLLHTPTTWIRERASSAADPVPAELVRELFGLTDVTTAATVAHAPPTDVIDSVPADTVPAATDPTDTAVTSCQPCTCTGQTVLSSAPATLSAHVVCQPEAVNV
ncbi:MAG: glutamyl-tRNA reductase [Litorilinea sp.]